MTENLELIFLTDSHGLYMARAIKNDLLHPFNIKVKRMNGATVSGLKNPNSFTAASKDYEKLLSTKKPKNTKIFMQLGEVDCGILLWLKAQKNGTDVLYECDKTIQDYINYVKKLNTLGFDKIILTSPTLPTITDDDDIGEIKSLRRKQIKATYRERTDLTLYFNKMLKEACQLHKIDYIDLTEDFLDYKTMLCKERFRNSNIEDHHMEYDEASIVWAKAIKQYLYRVSDKDQKIVFSKVIKDTYAKQLKKKSTYIPDKIYPLNIGDTLSYHFIYEKGKYIHVENLHVNGKKIDNSYIFLVKKHLNNE
ncbi:hypothetical protein ABEF85_14740 [Acinetobacter thermotolerans]|uniref:hypothetical protein n=1 Tax=Acinetobacter thermotolerans TaxID=3151487 RepID=UPI00325AA914